VIDEKDPLEEGSDDRVGGPDESGRGFVADAVRKAILAGVGAVFLTEEGARKLASEWKLPKELFGFVVGQAQGAKDEILRVLGSELRRLFESETFRREALKVLSSMAVEVKAEIRLKDAGGQKAPRVKTTVTPRAGAPGDEEAS
jgi:hypothetical protein